MEAVAQLGPVLPAGGSLLAMRVHVARIEGCKGCGWH